VYQRVLELAPNDNRAQAALNAFVEPEPRAPARKEKGKEPAQERSGVFRRYTGGEPAKKPPAPTLPELPPPRKVTPPAPSRGAAAASAPEDFVNLGEWLKDQQAPKSTRMVVEEQAPTGDEQADFADMLRRFKAGVAENVDDEDHESHYDLGVAYKEMGLLDEAIAEFQKALRAPEHRVRAYEALGQCFLEKGQFQVAATILARAEGERGVNDEQLVGVLYLLGYANEGLQKWVDALGYYQRVFAVDIQFRDVGERIAALERVVR
jgi:tetratricopeptide (TPR) repeat protein